MLNAILLIGLLATFNRIRGQIGHRLLTNAASAASVGFYAMAEQAGDFWFIGTVFGITFIGLTLWNSWGWGKYFSVFHGRDDWAEREINWLDKIGYRLVPYTSSQLNYVSPGTWRNRWRGWITMTMRGAFILPFILALVALTGNWAVLPLVLPLGLLQGSVYALGNFTSEKQAVPVAEILMGAVIAAIIILVL
ncbi:MAG: hypothetical protein E6R03_01520 [Hyphomicrobiaceae bacterium]|nr:MAG: hypothetical protein E6R03_01520 [Hyphomicrobiaceae bacterium]